jgi:hypothetical protein
MGLAYLGISPKKIDALIDETTGVIGDFALPMTSSQAAQSPLTFGFVQDSNVKNKRSGQVYDLKQKAAQEAYMAEESGYPSQADLALDFIADTQKGVWDNKDLIKEINKGEMTRQEWADLMVGNSKRQKRVSELNLENAEIDEAILSNYDKFREKLEKYYKIDENAGVEMQKAQAKNAYWKAYMDTMGVDMLIENVLTDAQRKKCGEAVRAGMEGREYVEAKMAVDLIDADAEYEGLGGAKANAKRDYVYATFEGNDEKQAAMFNVLGIAPRYGYVSPDEEKEELTAQDVADVRDDNAKNLELWGIKGYSEYKDKVLELKGEGGEEKEREKKAVLQDIGLSDGELVKIYAAEFEDSGTNPEKTIAYAVENGADPHTYVAWKAQDFWDADEIDETAGTKNEQSKRWILDNAATPEEMAVLYSMGFENKSTKKENSIGYAMEELEVRPENYIGRELQKEGEKGDPAPSTDLYLDPNGVEAIAGEDTCAGDKTARQCKKPLSGGYTDTEKKYFYQKEYGADDYFVVAMALGFRWIITWR